MRWFWLPWLVAGDLWDDEMWHELATRAVRLGRESGALNVLPAGARDTAPSCTCTRESSRRRRR